MPTNAELSEWKQRADEALQLTQPDGNGTTTLYFARTLAERLLLAIAEIELQKPKA
jgi:hypothetical protein